MPISSPFFGRAMGQLHTLPTIPQSLGINYLKATLQKTRFSSHVFFLRKCVRSKTIPNGFYLKFHSSSQSSSMNSATEIILKQAGLKLMLLTIRENSRKIEQADRQIAACRRQLASLCQQNMSHFIINTVRHANQALFNSLQETKTKKMSKLLNKREEKSKPTTPTQQQAGNSGKLVVTIPSDVHLPKEQSQLLSRGLKFIPLKPHVNFMSTIYHCQRFFRRLRLAAHFQNASLPSSVADSSDVAKLFPREHSNWTPRTGEYASLDYYITKCEQEIKQLHLKPLQHSNLSTKELKALDDLKKRDDVIVKPADKGGSVVVWRKDLYEREVRKQLADTSFYVVARKSTVKDDNALVRRTIKEAVTAGHLPSEAIRAVVREPRESRFYVLPKIHKVNNPGRPIVSACSCPTTIISQFLDGILKPLVASLPTYIKDTNHALQLLDAFRFPAGCNDRFLFTMDVTSLYTNIPHNEGLQALKHFLKKSSFKIDVTTILRLAELVLTLNTFSFGDQHYVQTRGVAMGTKMGPSYACLFVGFVEEKLFEAYTGHIPVFYKRFIDDVAGIATCTKDELQRFIESVSSFHPALKFTHQISTTTVSFLDISISITDSNILLTTVFYKDTDSHSYLTFSSSHPTSCRESIPYSQFLRLRRLCSDDADFQQQARQMTTFFTSRGYPIDIVREALKRASSVSRSQLISSLTVTRKQATDRTILTLVYHPHNIPVKNILVKNFNILQQDQRLKDVFSKPPLVAYMKDTTLKDHLVHSAFNRSNSNLQPGNRCCQKSGCKTCPFLNTNTIILRGPSGRSFTIRSTFTCQSTNLVYVISCNLCHKLYCGETYRSLDDRFKEHLQSVNLQKDNPVGNHFNSPGHNIHHIRVCAVHQNYTGSLHRKFLESSLISRLGTMAPLGINIRE
eukprot:TRINITY_DN3707_c0_g1_i1.p1 TRINITY_DN3707_c0_g1~~TRINITY_DN3707_c0_g1_i1.p1  ORF type:complete len:909 (-),score=150.62 TRINITY_DN3707_c0_g1_i1:630-3356(-)